MPNLQMPWKRLHSAASLRPRRSLVARPRSGVRMAPESKVCLVSESLSASAGKLVGSVFCLRTCPGSVYTVPSRNEGIVSGAKPRQFYC